MAAVERSVLVEHSVRQMQSLVEDIASYPRFLPWCGGADVVSSDAGTVVATIKIDYRGISQQFTTENTSIAGESIRIRLVSGPFRSLEGEWNFRALGDKACKVGLNLEYEFSNRVFDLVLGPVFHYIADSLVEAFVKRADAVYGCP